MSRKLLRLSLAALAIVQVCPSQGEAEFLTGLDRVRSMATKGDWRTAERAIHALLETHADTDYVRERRNAITEELQRCRFHLTHRPPAARRMIAGSLARYDKRSRSIKIIYEPSELTDFIREGKVGAWFHPVVFSGPYSVTITGRSYPTTGAGVRVFVCEDGESIVDVITGFPATSERNGVMATMQHCSPSGAADLVPAQNPVTAIGRPYRVTVEVGIRTIRTSLNGKPIMTAKRPGKSFGRFGFLVDDFHQLMVEGTASPGWIEGKIDTHMQTQLADFRERFDPRKHLPSWLFAKTSPSDVRGEPPARASLGTTAALTEVAHLINEGRYDQALQLADRLTDREVSDSQREYARAVCLSALERPESALKACDDACRADPESADGRGLRARIYAQLRRYDDAITELTELLEDHPDHGPAHQFLALLLLKLGRPEEAKDAITVARSKRASIPNLTHLESLLDKAMRGPDWRRVYSQRSTNYHVYSDVDQKTCVESARVLERALVKFQAQLGLKPRRTERFRVYIFSGESGYQSYCANVLGSVQPHTKGLYSPTLKQLLIWNLPDYEEVLHTVRHEGFHQFLDVVVDDPPPWINEGLAMYYERDEPKTVRTDLVATLSELGTKSLPEFLVQDHKAFYADATRNYAQAWAFIHFLRTTTHGNETLFKKMLAQLRNPISNGMALTNALRGVSIHELDSTFQAHVESLIALPARPDK